MQKVVFIDVDGTITRGKSSWELVHHHFEKYVPGMVDKMNENTKLWEDGKIDYETWAKMDVKLWKGQDYNEIRKALLPPDLLPGAKKGINELKENGFYTVLVSGGINVLVDAVKNAVGADEAYSITICEKEGKISGEVDDMVGNTKAEIVDMVVKKLDIEKSLTYAIGDHVNDIEMFEYVNYALGVNLKRERVREYADYVLEIDNFQIAAKHIVEVENGNI